MPSHSRTRVRVFSLASMLIALLSTTAVSSAEGQCSERQLCIHLALAGERERAYRIASQDLLNASHSSYLFKPLCLHAAQNGDLDTASRFADKFIAAAQVQSQDPERLSYTFDQLYELIQWMKQANQSDLASHVVRGYIELADRGAIEPDADIRRLFALHSRRHFVSFKDILSASEIADFAHRQSQSVIDQLDIENYGDKECVAEWRLALAQIGEIPTDVQDPSIQQQVPIVIALLDAGQQFPVKAGFR